MTMLKLGVLARMPSFLLVISSLFLGIGAYILYRMPEGNAWAETLRVDQPVIALGDLPPGVEIPVILTVTNSSDRAVKLLGIQEFCANWGCISNRSRFPCEIPTRSSSTLTLQVLTRAGGVLGDFTGESILYSDAPCSEQITLVITGRIVVSTSS